MWANLLILRHSNPNPPPSGAPPPPTHHRIPTMPHRSGPTPSLNLQIPSLHDSLPLDARIYLPPIYTTPTPSTPWSRKVAIIAHPYAPLGGCYDEFVVLRLAAALLKTGWVVATFNFRYCPSLPRPDQTNKSPAAPTAQKDGHHGPETPRSRTTSLSLPGRSHTCSRSRHPPG